MNSNLRTKDKLQQRVGILVAGTQKHFPTGPLTVGGVTYESATLIQILQGLGTAIAGADVAKTQWNDALKNMQDQVAKAVPVLRAYQSYLIASFGNAPSTLAEFGLVPRSGPASLTVEQKAAAAAKGAATRAARHTQGSVQKKAVKGNVTGVVVTPIAATQPSAANPASGAPAPTASPTGSAPHTAT
jgi:hypothetical protein